VGLGGGHLQRLGVGQPVLLEPKVGVLARERRHRLHPFQPVAKPLDLSLPVCCLLDQLVERGVDRPPALVRGPVLGQ
jgi:hypothetical protein